MKKEKLNEEEIIPRYKVHALCMLAATLNQFNLKHSTNIFKRERKHDEIVIWTDIYCTYWKWEGENKQTTTTNIQWILNLIEQKKQQKIVNRNSSQVEKKEAITLNMKIEIEKSTTFFNNFKANDIKLVGDWKGTANQSISRENSITSRQTTSHFFFISDLQPIKCLRISTDTQTYTFHGIHFPSIIFYNIKNYSWLLHRIWLERVLNTFKNTDIKHPIKALHFFFVVQVIIIQQQRE